MAAKTPFLFFALGLLALLAGCADPDTGFEREPPVKLEDVPTAQKEAYAASFPLYDGRTGLETPPVGPDGKAPFGVLIDFVNRKELGICTLTHFSPGVLLTNAHCVARDPRVEAYYVVFYDRDGQHAFAPIRKFRFVGDQRGEDFAVLEIDATDAARWDALSSTVTSTASFRNRSLGSGSFRTTVWAFDPMPRHPEIDPFGHGRGAVFMPRQCNAFRTLPQVDLFTDSDSMPYPWTPSNPAIHLFLDHCTRALVNGNSGSLITEGTDTRSAVGVFHWVVALKDPRLAARVRSYRYTGSLGTPETIPGGHGVSLYQVGTDLETARQRHPGAF